MANKIRVAAALKAMPPGTRGSLAPQSSGMGRISPVQSEMYYQNPYRGTYGPFMPRQPEVYSDGAFSPLPPIQPVPVDQPPAGGMFPDPRYWQYTPGWNLPTPPGTEGLKLASFDQLRTISDKYCLSPETWILCSDFTWRGLGTLSVGDEIIGFDETPPGPRQHRKMRTAIITSCDRIKRPSYRITLTDGRQITASAEHLWLSGHRGGNIREFTGRDCDLCGRFFSKAHALGAHRKRAHGIEGWWKQQDNGAWIATDQLRPGSTIKDIGKPWLTDDSRAAGYLSGVYDGEASFAIRATGKSSWDISFPQKPGVVFDTVLSILKDKNFRVRTHGPDKAGCEHAVISGIDQCFRFLGAIHPLRLLQNSGRWIDGRSPSRSKCAVVQSVEFLGEREVIAVGTSTKTLIAQGLFSHNSVARACIDLRQQEIRGLTWEITMTKEAAKAYQGSHSMMKDFGQRAAEATAFFRRPDKGYWNFDSFLNAMLEEIFVYDALCLIFRPKYGAKFGMTGKGLLGSDLDTLRLVPGPTIRPLVDLHGDPPMPPNPAYQQYLFGVPRSDYQTIMYGDDIESAGISGEHVAEYRSDMMLYAPYWPRRESPYGQSPVEKALVPIISGLQKQEFQLDYFKEGSVPAVYISPGDPNITPTQIRELQDALNGIAGDPAFHLKVVVLPPGSKVDPQRPVDLSDGFDQLVMEQVCMAFDVQPMELGIIPNIGGGQQGPSASAIRFAAQETRDIKSRHSTKPLLKFICDIFNMVLQDICGQHDMRFQFEGLADDEDKQAITELGVQQVQNGIASIDEVRDRLDMAPWGLKETSEPVVFTAQGPIPFSMAPQLILAAQQAAGGGNSGGGSSGGKKSNNRTQSTNSGQRTSKPKTKQPAIRAGGQTKPNGSHPAPVSPHRESLTPGHSAAAGTVQSSTPRTGGTPSRSSVAGSRKKAIASELDSLKRHLRKDREAIYNWEPRHIDTVTLAKIADDLNSGTLIDVAVKRAQDSFKEEYIEGIFEPKPLTDSVISEWHVKVPEAPDSVRLNVGNGINYIQDNYITKKQQWPGWEHDLGLVGAYKQQVGDAFKAADVQANIIRKQAASGKMYVDNATLRNLIAEEVHGTFLNVLQPMWTEAWHLGYEAAKSLVTGEDADFTVKHESEALNNFVATEGDHWAQKISRTGLRNADTRAETIARTEVARAMNAAAIQAYRDNGISHKHLLLAPEDTCTVCKAARKEGVIPLDAIFSGGGLGGPFHPQCVIGSTRVAADGVFRSSERNYVGEIVTVRTASGYELTATPNHPVATRRGWIPISELKVGDDVLTSNVADRAPGMVPNVDNVKSTIKEIAESLPVHLGAMPTAAEHFHGDTSDGDVCVIRTNSPLGNNGNPSLLQEIHNKAFGIGNIPAVETVSFDAARDSFSVSATLRLTANSYMSRFSKLLAFSGADVSHSGVHGGAAVSAFHTSVFEAARDDVPADMEGFCETLLGLASDVTTDKIIDVQVDFRSTQVYNLETTHGWYVANNIITHNCRCVPAPAGVEVEPPQAHIRKSEQQDDSRAAFLMLRSINPDTGKRMYLLQKRDDGPWGLPGGTAHMGENAWDAAVRECTEEIGDLPTMLPEAHMVFPVEDKTIHVFVCSTPMFSPKMNGGTSFETHGTAWFKRKEVKDLDLHPHFEEQWKAIDWDDLGKMIANTEMGEMLTTDSPVVPAGARWPYPHRSDGAEDPHYGSMYTDAFPSRDPSRNTPAAHGPVDLADKTNPRLDAPGGDETAEFPKKRTRNRGPKKLPSQEPAMPQNTQGGTESGRNGPGVQTGVPPSGEKTLNPTTLYVDMLMGRIPLPKAGPKPVVGSVSAEASRPMSPHAEEPETYDPAESVAVDTPEGDAYYPQPKKNKGDAAADAAVEDHTFPSTIPAHIIYLQMSANFPPDAIEWVKRADWQGPIDIPWEQIDTDDIKSWAASKQPGKVKEFERMIKAHDGDVKPSILIQDDDTPKAIIVDGHHRGLAWHNLGMPVLSYLGRINPEDRQAAEETHSQQIHQGSDPKNV